MNHRRLRVNNAPASRDRRPSAGLILDDASLGRIEEWVVSTLDDRAKSTGETDWMASLDGLTLTKRPMATRTNPVCVPNEPVGWARFRLSKRRGIAIVSLTDQSLVKEDDLSELIGDLKALIEAGHRRVILDFFAVERLSSWAARVLDETVRSCGMNDGTAIKFSGLKPDVAMIFAMTGLDPKVALYPDTASAVAGVWPDLPDLRPIPVSILSALVQAEETRETPRFRSASLSRLGEEQPVMSAARLIVQDGRSLGKAVTIKGTRFVIGRGPDCDLRIRSATVSRSHAVIERRGSKLFLSDLSSTNGTSLNGRAVRDRETEIRDGDTIRVGKMSFTLRVGRTSQTVILKDQRIDDDFPVEDHRGPTTAFDSNDLTEESFDVSSLGQEIGLKYEVIDDVLIVTPLTADFDEQSDVDTLRDGLLSLSARNLPKRVVVSLTNVSHLSGRAIGVLVAHHLRLDRSGGALRICLANPRVAVVLEQIKLGMLVDYHPNIEDAVIAAWPEVSKMATQG